MKKETQCSIFTSATLMVVTLSIVSIAFATAQTTGQAKGQTEHAVALLTRYEVKDEHPTQLRKAMGDYVLHSLNDESNIMCEAYYEQDNQSVLWLIERWNSYAALNKFRESNYANVMKSFEEETLVKTTRRFIRDLEPLSKSQWRRNATVNDDQRVIMLFVDAKNGTEQHFKDLYHVAMPHFRGEPGVITYQLSQLEDEATQFVTFEKFRSDEAFQYHLKFPPIKPVIAFLNSSIKKQPFQDGLHTLIEFAPLIRE